VTLYAALFVFTVSSVLLLAEMAHKTTFATYSERFSGTSVGRKLRLAQVQL